MSTTQCTGNQEERERYLRAMKRLKLLSVPQGRLDRRTHQYEVRRNEQVFGAFSTFAGAVHHAEYNARFQEVLEVWDARADQLLAAVFGVDRVQYTDVGGLFEEDSDAAFDRSLD